MSKKSKIAQTIGQKQYFNPKKHMMKLTISIASVLLFISQKL